jgi:hypothetical protein
MIGYFRKDLSWSVEYYQGQWIWRNRVPGDMVAYTPEQLEAVADWCRRNVQKYYESINR